MTLIPKSVFVCSVFVSTLFVGLSPGKNINPLALHDTYNSKQTIKVENFKVLLYVTTGTLQPDIPPAIEDIFGNTTNKENTTQKTEILGPYSDEERKKLELQAAQGGNLGGNDYDFIGMIPPTQSNTPNVPTNSMLGQVIWNKQQTQYNMVDPFAYMTVRRSGSLSDSSKVEKNFIASIFQLLQSVGIIGCISTILINLTKLYVATKGEARENAKNMIFSKSAILFMIFGGVFIFGTIARIITHI